MEVDGFSVGRERLQAEKWINNFIDYVGVG